MGVTLRNRDSLLSLWISSHCLKITSQPQWLQTCDSFGTLGFSAPMKSMVVKAMKRTASMKKVTSMKSMTTKKAMTPKTNMKKVKKNTVMKKKTNTKKETFYTRCIHCNSLREKLMLRRGRWTFKDKCCLDCGGMLDIISLQPRWFISSSFTQRVRHGL